MKTLEFSVRGLPPTQTGGGRGHWAKRHREVKQWRELVAGLARAHRGPGPPWPRARVRITRRSAKEPDADNLVASMKPILDGLVVAGVIPDDSPKHVELEVVWEAAPPGSGEVHLRVTALPPARSLPARPSEATEDER